MTNYYRQLSITTILLLTIVISSTMANGQTNKNFDTLLDAYAKAKINYKLASDLDKFSEINYWGNQYNFYHSKIIQLINDADQAARKNPRAFCLQALKMYSKYLETDGSVMLFDGMDDSMFYFQMSSNLSDYCSRYEIYYNPYEEKM